MASAFWTLEDGRSFSRPWSWMSSMLHRITKELKAMEGAEAFGTYLEKLVYSEEKGDIYNGFGGFIRGDENIMLDFDLRTFTPLNQEYFWIATQKALITLMVQKNDKNEGMIVLLSILLDMHKSIKKGEDPMQLNHLGTIEKDPMEKFGPGWE